MENDLNSKFQLTNTYINSLNFNLNYCKFIASYDIVHISIISERTVSINRYLTDMNTSYSKDAIRVMGVLHKLNFIDREKCENNIYYLLVKDGNNENFIKDFVSYYKNNIYNKYKIDCNINFIKDFETIESIEPIILQLFLNSIPYYQNNNSLEYINTAGKLYKIVKENNYLQLLTLKFDVTQDLLLIPSVNTFTSIYTLLNDSTKKLFKKTSPRYLRMKWQYSLSGNNFTLISSKREVFNFDDYWDKKEKKYIIPKDILAKLKNIFIKKQIDNKKYNVPYLCLTYERDGVICRKDELDNSKVGQMYSVIEIINDKFADVLDDPITFKSIELKNYPISPKRNKRSCIPNVDSQEKRYDNLFDILHLNLRYMKVNLVIPEDYYEGNYPEYMLDINEKVENFKNILCSSNKTPSFISSESCTISNKPSEDSLNILFIHKKEYYRKKKLYDNYLKTYQNCIIQHIILDEINFNSEKDLFPIIRTCLLDLLIKYSIYTNTVSKLLEFFNNIYFILEDLRDISFIWCSNPTILYEKDNFYVINTNENDDEDEDEDEDKNTDDNSELRIYAFTVDKNLKISLETIKDDNKYYNNVKSIYTNMKDVDGIIIQNSSNHDNAIYNVIQKTQLLILGGKDLIKMLKEDHNFVKHLRAEKGYPEYNNIMRPFLNINSFFINGVYHYTVGRIATGMDSKDFKCAVSIRKVTTLNFDLNLKDTDVIFQKNPNILKTLTLPLTIAKGLNVLPFPMKFLREYEQLIMKKLLPKS